MNSAAGVVRALWHLLLLAGMLCTAGTASTALAGALPVGPIKTHLLSAAQPAFDIQDGVHALMETGPSAGIAAIADGARGAFLPHPAGTIYALSERNTLWIHLRLERAPNAPADWTLHIPLPYLDHAVLYQVNPKGQWESQVSGDMTPVSQWTRPGLYPEFQLNNFSGGPQDVYLQIRNYKSLGIPLRLASAAARDSQREVEYVAIGLLLGSLAMLLASCAMQYLISKEDTDGWYTLYIALMTVVIAGTTGLSGQWLWPNSPNWSNYAFIVLPVLGVGATILFARHLCDLDVSFPRLSRGLEVLGWSSLVLAGLSLFIDRANAGILQAAYLALGPIMIIGITLAVWRRGNTIGRWLFLAYLPQGLAVIFLAAQMFNLVETFWLARYAMALAVSISMPMVLHALHLRARNRQDAEGRASALSTQDALTGLLVKPLFMTHVQEALTRALRDRETSAVVLVEVVNHAQLREVYGEAVAEQCLLRAVVKLHRVLRDVDPAGRVHTSRFGLILEGVASRHALNERMVSLIASGLIPLPGLQPEVTLHFHIACVLLNESIPDPRTILEQLDDILDNMAPRTRRPIRFLEPLQTIPAPVGESSGFGEDDTGSFMAPHTPA